VSDNDRLDRLEARIEALEDEREIRDVLTRYGLAVDSGDTVATIALYAPDCAIDIDAAVFMNGKEEARFIVESPAHQEILPDCAHVMGPFAVTLNGTTAVATGYATVFVRTAGKPGVWRQSFGRWELEKRDGRWAIVRRVSRSVGRPDAGELFLAARRDGLPPAAGQ
jgi:ketosteroid isomerase-like protein